MNGNDKARRNEIIGSAIAIGAGGGVALGLVLAQILGHVGFMSVGIAIGLCLGLVIGLFIANRGGGNDAR
ncbi:MAG: hypothetical protein KDE59_10850 [Anaerolineales bacterium]|nr:hypothetical protein [Anaerolineales bacterium]MCB0014646.1 hypothetical protein [Anaerolineales bacterium]